MRLALGINSCLQNKYSPKCQVEKFSGGLKVWIGLRRDQGDRFVWNSGRNLSLDVAQKWHPDQPDNANGDEDCATMKDKGIRDLSCAGDVDGFICQKRGEQVSTKLFGTLNLQRASNWLT